MNCTRAQHSFVAYLHGELTPEHNTALLNHVAECSDCRAKLEFERLLQDSLRALPVPEPKIGFLDRVYINLEQVTQKRSHGGDWFKAGALAATLALCVSMGVMIFQFSRVDTVAYIEMAVDEVKTVRLKFNAPHDFDKVTLSLYLPEHMELQGYPGQRQLQWETRLTAGVNVLSLSIIAHKPLDGVVIASISGKNKKKTKEFKVHLRASQIQGSLTLDHEVI